MPKRYSDIKDLLANKAIQGLHGRGVSAKDIKNSEITLGVSFPESYRDFLCEYGWGYFGSLELIAGLGSDIPKEWEAGANVIKVATDERNGPSKFPYHIIPISPNGAGDWYAIDCSVHINNESPIVFVSHERVARDGFSSEQRSENFAEWMYLNLSN